MQNQPYQQLPSSQYPTAYPPPQASAPPQYSPQYPSQSQPLQPQPGVVYVAQAQPQYVQGVPIQSQPMTGPTYIAQPIAYGVGVPLDQKQPLRGSWTDGICDCFSDCESACCSCLCPCIRWSQTVSRAGLLPLTKALLIYGLFVFVVYLFEIGRAVQQECRDRSRMPSSA
eukprot:TRINITY_DN438_c0_g1_i14.p1 TRINITY_DN438_c0_g1~~TRINITY_DN438_c0_g1_i14.p1  ORF type:complete len:170 (+),score=10.79 TRINITY_DN438_c0_g1_i14:99-608(+)